MQADALLDEITSYCRKNGVAESTFGRLAVNDGKFVNRLREGGRITTTTFERVRSFIAADSGRGSLLVGGASEVRSAGAVVCSRVPSPRAAPPPPSRNRY